MRIIDNEEDLLKDLPDNYMNSEQLDFFRRRLINLAEELRFKGFNVYQK